MPVRVGPCVLVFVVVPAFTHVLHLPFRNTHTYHEYIEPVIQMFKQSCNNWTLHTNHLPQPYPVASFLLLNNEQHIEIHAFLTWPHSKMMDNFHIPWKTLENFCANVSGGNIGVFSETLILRIGVLETMAPKYFILGIFSQRAKKSTHETKDSMFRLNVSHYSTWQAQHHYATLLYNHLVIISSRSTIAISS